MYFSLWRFQAKIKTFSQNLQVPNIVPSISAVIGGNTPERYIWRIGMAFFSFPRMLDSFLYYKFFSSSPGGSGQISIMNGIVWLLHVGQYMSLFTLSFVSSTENYGEWVRGGWQKTEIVIKCRCIFLFLSSCTTLLY